MKRTDRAGVFFVILVLTLFGVILNHRGVESSALNAGASTASLKKKGKVDSLKDTAYHAVNIREYHPAPAWETLFHNEGVSDIQFLSKDKILVATIQLQGAAGNPRSGSFIVYDVTSGEKIWERPRKQLLGKDSIDNVISTTPVIIDLNSSLEEYVFTAVDPETGEQLWEYKTKGPQAYALSPSHNSLLLSSRSGSNVVVTSLSLKNGQELWSVKLPEPSLEKAKAAEVKIQGSDVFIFGSQVNKLSMADGAHSWSAAFSADGVVPDNLIINPEGIYVANGTTLKILDLKDGRVLWEYTSSDAPILLISPYPGKVFTLIGEIAQESPAYKVLALDAASGKVFWSYPLKASLSSSFLYYADFLYFTTPSSLIALNANSGQLKSSTHLPDKMQATPLLPDILKAIGDRLLVVREKAGLAAFDLSSSELLFHQSPISCPGFLSSNARFYGLQGVMNMYLKSPENAEQVDKDFAEMRESMRKNFLVNAQRSTEASLMMDIYSLDLEPGTSTSSIMPQNLQESSLVSMARRHTEWAKRSGGDDLVTALRLESAALKVDAAMESMMRTISLCNQVVDLFFTLRAQRELSKIQANISRRQVELTGAIKYHALSLQNDYYLYPFRQWGRGVTIVNTGTGLRTDLVYSPQNIVHDSFRGIEYPVFAVCPEGKRLITYGISLNPNKYEGYVRENTTVPYQSIFCYDLKSLEFKKANNNSIDFTGAVAQGDIPKLNKALAEGVNVNSRGVTGNTGLIYAAQKGYVEVVKLLLKSGADPNLKGDWGTALHAALSAWSNKPEIFKLLLEAGGDVNIKNRMGVSVKDVALQSATHADIARLISMQAGERPDIASFEDALAYGDIDSVKSFLDRGANPNKKLKDGRTPLMAAAANGDTQIILLLLERGVDIHQTSDERKDTALMWAARLGHLEAVRVLCEKGADLDAKNTYQETALYLAVTDKSHAKDIVKYLAEKGADINAQRRTGSSPLDASALMGYREVLDILIQAGANINIQDKDGKTPLMTACSTMFAGDKKSDVIKMLIDAGTDIEKRDKDGDTALFYAVNMGDLPTVDQMIEAGADIHARNDNKNTPFINAAALGNTKKLEILMKAGSAVDAKNKDGETALMFAASKGHIDAVRLLIDAGADVNTKNKKGWTAKDYVKKRALRNRKEILALLDKDS